METDDKKYEVTLSVRLHGAFTVLAADESCAEEIVNRMFAEGEIKLGDLEFADETRVDCTGESEPNAKAVNEDGGDEDGAEDGDEPPVTLSKGDRLSACLAVFTAKPMLIETGLFAVVALIDAL